jgi:Flp pilus assembly protein TadB
VLLSFILFLLLLQCFNFSSFKLLSLKAKKKSKKKQLQQQKKRKERKREAQQQHTHTHLNRTINYLNTQSFLRKGGVTAPHHNVAFFLIFKCPAVCLTHAIKITHKNATAKQKHSNKK